MKKRQITAPARGATLRDWRLRLLALILVLLFALLGTRLFYLQIICGNKYAKKAHDLHLRKVPVDCQRGAIVDRSGQELAVDLPLFYSVGVYPAQLKQAGYLCQKLSSFTQRPISHYKHRLESRSNFLYLEWRVKEAEALELAQANIEGVILQKMAGRCYPYDRTTSQLLGFTDIDGRGIAGLELYCDSVLQGLSGWEMHQRDAVGISFWDPLDGSISALHGGTVRLSLDIIAQEVLYQELERALQETHAQWVGGVMIDPTTGEILGLASLPDFDPVRPEFGERANQKLRPLTDQMEPGSIFKVVAAAAALDQGLVHPQDMFYCENGRYRIGNRILGDAHAYGALSFEDVLVHSSNIGTAKIAERIGSRELYRYAVRFGFGSITGIEYPGEGSGMLRNHTSWGEIGRANIAIGQGVSVTMLQMAMAYGAIANDGIIMEPRLILDQTDARGKHSSFPPLEVRRVMEPETARTLQNILAQVVERGTGRAAALDSILQIAGKTGTAQIPNLVHGGYFQDRYVASFVGFLPANNARRLLVISVVDPQGAYYGAQVAAPVFKRVMARLQPADSIRIKWKEKPVELVEIPAKFEDGSQTARDSFGLERSYSTIANAANVEAQAAPASRLQVPDLRGLTLREAVRLLTGRGLKADISGKRKVLAQSPAPGAPIEKNGVCQITAEMQ